ncbi:MAG: GDP-mannose 4,6-dehydratase [Gammaproteobacteria bacterium]|nr:GDP-mannose 4,6-dehydratase [Gammaproteobacteria bacterium]
MNRFNVAQSDLDEIASQLKDQASDLKDAQIFITGGTGFFGAWLIQSFLKLNQVYQLNAQLHILSRNPERFLNQYPQLKALPELHWLKGDIQNFTYPATQMTHIIHAATSVAENEPLSTLDTITLGTRHILDYAKSLALKPKVLFISSGAVYGKQPAAMTHIPETAPTAPDLYGIQSAYGLGKCMAEHLCYQYHRTHGLLIKIARCFAFIGPHLPLDQHFAIGNFLACRLKQEPITVKATSQVFRSYQYTTDLMVWLWTILISGQEATPYNVGSDDGRTLNDFAKLVAEMEEPILPIHMPQQGADISRYVPSIDFAKKSLGLTNHVSIEEALRRTLAWHRH